MVFSDKLSEYGIVEVKKEFIEFKRLSEKGVKITEYYHPVITDIKPSKLKQGYVSVKVAQLCRTFYNLGALGRWMVRNAGGQESQYEDEIRTGTMRMLESQVTFGNFNINDTLPSFHIRRLNWMEPQWQNDPDYGTQERARNGFYITTEVIEVEEERNFRSDFYEVPDETHKNIIVLTDYHVRNNKLQKEKLELVNVISKMEEDLVI